MPATITEDNQPSRDRVLAADLAFHLGSRDSYDLAIGERVANAALPDEAFAGLRIDRGFFAGEFYKRHCRIGEAGISVADGAEIDQKQRRTLAVINRDFTLLGRSVPYAYEMRDGRQYDYAALFGTKKPIPVFQYHRRKGRAAIIHPLPGFHSFPSEQIPKVEDSTPFLAKRPKAVWRGRLSGRVSWRGGYTGFSKVAADATLSNDERSTILLDQMPRAAICARHRGSEIVDAGLVVGDAGMRGASVLAPLSRDRLSIEEQLGCRYLLAIDGNDCPSSLYWMLSTNSLVLRQESPWEAYGDCYFEPWVHYVPFARDGADLTDKLEWCEDHLAECARMVANAHSAFSVLFDKNFRHERRRAALAAYRAWFD